MRVFGIAVAVLVVVDLATAARPRRRRRRRCGRRSSGVGPVVRVPADLAGAVSAAEVAAAAAQVAASRSK